MNIDIVERAPARIAYLRYTGPLGEPLVRFWRGTVAPWLADHDLIDCPRFGVCLDDPLTTSSAACRYDAGVELPPGVNLPDAEQTTIAGGAHAVARFKGTGAQIGGAWREFLAAAAARSLAPDTARAPFEYYPRGAGYDPRSGVFACELCLPLAARDDVQPEEFIGRATPADAPAILELQKLAYAAEGRRYDDWNLPPLTQTLDSLRAEFAEWVVLKLVADGVIIASVRGRRVGDTWHIGRLIVHPDFEGQGLGTRLMRAIERESGDSRRFELFTGHRSERNIRLYERLGYVRCREQELSPAVTLVFMEKLR